MLENLIKSEYLNSIYYADLFSINGKVWFIMGHGKSKASKLASGNSLARDSIALKLDNNNDLRGRYDPGLINPNFESIFYKIDYVVYCLSKEDSTNMDKITEYPLAQFASCSIMHHYPVLSKALEKCSDEERDNLCNTQRQRNKFYEIMEQSNIKKFLLLPYMDTLEEKALLYQKYDILYNNRSNPEIAPSNTQ